MPGLEFDPESATLLYFKVGVFGGTPLEFCEALATTYEARYFSSGQLRDAINDERVKSGNPRRVSTEDIGKRLADEAGPILRTRRDVFADVFYNTPNTRSLVPIPLAKKTGAITVALNIVTPLDRVEERVGRWVEEESLGRPSRKREAPPFSIMRQMFDALVRPREEEDLGLVIRVDGSSDKVSDLIDQVEDQLDAHGLLEDY